MMLKVPMAEQNQHYLANGSRLNCLIVASADFQKHEDLARRMHLISKLLVNTAGQPLDFPNDLTRFHNMLCTNHPLPTFLHKCTIFAGQVEHVNGKRTLAPIYILYITLPPSVIEVRVTSHKFPWKRKFLISPEHSLVISTNWHILVLLPGFGAQ